ncbi:MAG: DUF423 domain-containing protein [Candidatus Thiodiazotropha sp. (ex Dulcina madagascariensis)]|nr:DUF423 domain-containing protein [Candidatus Thiodiazotropha sp. (ex Epidulcina cf. delphinae)]MCU7923213.1 DUF423 domain-containing protein [Candidatus Thiodiazotropha sp. (ex Dulcina madagascariensis)]MCU7924901.1 DUF423 domain-containing protein [Candidatus Thiodiazotropha sp. (ex Dulcina madagascariensis)]
MARRFLFIAAVSGMLVVMLGAFGAHALEARLPAAHLGWWQKAVHYQGLHTLALLGAGLLALQRPGRTLLIAGLFFLTGIILFSGSLYLLALTGQRGLALLTPLGGIAFIAGWFTLALAAWRLPR